ncbi:hypothetical protein EDC62_0119 [Tibeticola sediminis]|uniref:Probable membrane transporter protein n=1 Tax=Tibeticola sediminis TaxID=1917811 RepID=A0A3N4VEY0_9BURK|nr:sulfite exporter TauE/SafE family protein [Tibeticola sediminis]RPE72430.1 hypothetical protein EDC62_0119 [Tibeticola sediminis]
MDALSFWLSGAVVGLIIGLTGVGGGSLMTPLLIFGFGIHPALAVGTDLLFAAFTKLGGTVAMMRRGWVPWPVVGALALGSLPAAGITLLLIRAWGPAHPGVQDLILQLLGLALLLTAGATLYKAWVGSARSHRPEAADAPLPPGALRPRHWSLPVLLGALIGVLVTLTSVGAGAIGVSALLFLYPRLPLSRVVAADIAYAVPLTLVAGLGHATLGNVDVPMLFWLLAGSLPGIWLGSRGVIHISERWSRSVLSLLLLWAGSKLILH